MKQGKSTDQGNVMLVL